MAAWVLRSFLRQECAPKSNSFFAPAICPREIMPNGPHARSTRKQVGPYPIQEGADAQFRDGHACWDCEGGPRALTDEG